MIVTLILILDIIAILDVLLSKKTIVKKLLWMLVILLFPFVGMIFYFLLDRDGQKICSD